MQKLTSVILTAFLMACNAPKQFHSIDQASQQKAGDENCQGTSLTVNIPSQTSTGIPFQLSVNHPQAHWKITYHGSSTIYDGQVITLNLTQAGFYSGLVTSADECGVPDTVEFSFLVSAGVQSPMIKINNGAAFTNNQQVSLSLAALNADQMFITNNSGCSSGGVWEAYATGKAWSLSQKNNSNTVYAKFKNATSTSSCVQAQILHDDIAPALAWIKAPTSLTADTSAHFEWSAAESGSGLNLQSCSIDGQASSSCQDMLDYTNLAIGPHKFTVDAIDNAGNTSKISYQWQISPVVGSSSLVINSGAAYTKYTKVQLTLNSSNATEMYVTNVADCSSGGGWESFASQKTWNLSAQNQLTGVYAKFRNSVSSTACVSAQITHDDTAPVISFTQKPANPSNEINPQFAWTISDNLSGIKTQLCSLDSQAYTTCNLSINFANLSFGPHSFTVVGYDFAGNQSQVNYAWTIAPIVGSPTLVINGGAFYTTNQQVSLALSAVNADQMFITNNPNCSTDGVWEAYATQKNWNLNSSNQQNAVFAKFRNKVSETVCITAQIIHDNLAPVISFTSKPLTSTMDTDAKFAWTLSDNLSGVASEQCQLDSQALADCKNALSYTKLSVGIHSFSIVSADNAGNVASLSHSWTITAPPPPVLSEGTCKGGESLTSCLTCVVPQPPVIPPWTPGTKAEKLAEIQRLSCVISNKSDYMYNNYDASRPPTREQIFSKIQACTAELYPDSPLSGASLDTINALLNAQNDSMRKKIYGGLWYKPPYTDYFELYFGLSSLEARQIFCYGQGAANLLKEDLITSEYAEACYDSEAKCNIWKHDKNAQARWKEVQKFRKQLRGCIDKSMQLPPVEPPKPWVQPVCTYKEFAGYFEVGGKAYLDGLLASGYKVSVESNNACMLVTSSQSFKGIVHIAGYKCQ